MLKGRLANLWVDPRAYKSVDEFMYAYSVARGLAEGANEILTFVDQMKTQAHELKEKAEGRGKADKFRDALS